MWQGPRGWWCVCNGREPWPRTSLTFDGNPLLPLAPTPKLTVLWGHPVVLLWRGSALQRRYLLLRDRPFQKRPPASVLTWKKGSESGPVSTWWGHSFDRVLGTEALPTLLPQDPRVPLPLSRSPTSPAPWSPSEAFPDSPLPHLPALWGQFLPCQPPRPASSVNWAPSQPLPHAHLCPISAWPLPRSMPMLFGHRLLGSPRCGADLSSEVLLVGWGRGCLPLL